MTPQSISQRARELWEQAKAEDGWDDSMRMAYIMGACDGMADMQERMERVNIKDMLEVKIPPLTEDQLKEIRELSSVGRITTFDKGGLL